MTVQTQTTINLEDADFVCVSAHERFGGQQIVSLHRAEFSIRFTPAHLSALREAVEILERSQARELQGV